MDNSPFARLSAELRNKIYEFVLVEIKPRVELHQFPSSNNLTKTCRQIRRESSLIFWSSNHFLEYDARDWDLIRIRAHPRCARTALLLNSLGKEVASCIKCLTLVLDVGILYKFHGLESGGKKLGEARAAERRETRVVKATDWGAHLQVQPILHALLDLGFKLRVVKGLAFDVWDVIMVEE